MKIVLQDLFSVEMRGSRVLLISSSGNKRFRYRMEPIEKDNRGSSSNKPIKVYFGDQSIYLNKKKFKRFLQNQLPEGESVKSVHALWKKLQSQSISPRIDSSVSLVDPFKENFISFRKKMERIISGNPDAMSTDDFLELKLLHRELKRMAKLSPDSKEIVALNWDYIEFIRESVALILFKRGMRLIKETPSIAKDRNHSSHYRGVDLIFKLLRDVEPNPKLRRVRLMESKQFRHDFKVRFWRVFLEAKPLLGRSWLIEEKYDLSRNITWLHGTNSSALAVMLHLNRINKTEKPILMPTGKLVVEYQTPPFSGELDWGILSSGINQSSLSGVKLCHFVLAAQYAKQPGSAFNLEREVLFIRENLQRRDASFEISPRLYLAYLRLMRLGVEPQLIDEFKQKVQSHIEAGTLDLRRNPWLNKFLESPVEPFEFDETEKRLLDTAFPIVFGSFTLDNLKYPSSDLSDSIEFIRYAEVSYEGSVALTDQVQLAFTDEQHIEELREILLPWGVQVFSLDVGLLLSKIT